MNKLKNRQNINCIKMLPTACTKCVIGQDWYKNELEILFYPADYYPDYMQVNKYIMDNIDGKDLNIEDVVQDIFNYLNNNYNPKRLIVIDHIRGCKTHFDVDVIKSSMQ